jgi:methylthioribulose-1-phosphate dehydratase
MDYLLQRDALIETGRYFHGRGWSLGTSSNYSIVVGRNPLRLLITASGKDKGRLGREDFVVVDEAGKAIDPAMPKPSAETLLHTRTAALNPGVGSILHTHSVWGTILSDLNPGGFEIAGYEMLKGLSGIGTHEHTYHMPVVANTQDIGKLAEELTPRLKLGTVGAFDHGYLLRKHGLYTWGGDLDEARRHVEIYEFLFEVVGRRGTAV